MNWPHSNPKFGGVVVEFWLANSKDETDTIESNYLIRGLPIAKMIDHTLENYKAFAR
jgi:hypothetical protein